MSSPALPRDGAAPISTRICGGTNSSTATWVLPSTAWSAGSARSSRYLPVAAKSGHAISNSAVPYPVSTAVSVFSSRLSGR